MPKIANSFFRVAWAAFVAGVGYIAWNWGDKKIVTATEENRYVGEQAISKTANTINTPENQKAVLDAATQITGNVLSNASQKASLQPANDGVSEKSDEAPDKVSENDSIC